MEVDKLVKLIKQIAQDAVDANTSAKKVLLRCTSLDPPAFETIDKKITVKGKALYLPYDKILTEADLGEIFPFLRNEGGQEYILIGELRDGNKEAKPTKLNENIIGAAQIQGGAIQKEHVGAGVISAESIENGAITSEKIGDGSIFASKLNLPTHMLT